MMTWFFFFSPLDSIFFLWKKLITRIIIDFVNLAFVIITIIIAIETKFISRWQNIFLTQCVCCVISYCRNETKSCEVFKSNQIIQKKYIYRTTLLLLNILNNWLLLKLIAMQKSGFICQIHFYYPLK